MSQSGFTPIQLYYSTTASTAPSAGNLANGELAINITDGKLFYKDNGGVVQVLATKGAGTIGGATTQVQYNNAGTLAGSANMTFDGTTLTLGANPVLSGGTANGVAYLNGSKVLTTGSALTFNGSELGISGSGRLQTLTSTGDFSSTGTAYLRWYDSVGAKGYIGYAGTASTLTLASSMSGLDLQSNTYVTFSTPTEQMRLTSTGLGIGTSSITNKLTVNGSIGASGSSGAFSLYRRDTNAYAVGMYSASGGLLIDMPGVGTAATLDSSGNLGLGVTSIPTVGSTTVFAVGAASGGTLAITQSGSIVYRTSASTSGVDFYNPNASPLQWYTAGALRMTLDSTGKLIANGSVAGANTVLTLQESSALSAALAFRNRNSTQMWTIAVDGAAVDDKLLAFIDSTNNLLRMALTDAGNLLVGKTSNSVSVVGSSLDGSGQSRFSNSSTSSGSTLEVYSTGASAYRFYVSWGGQISATSTSISGISDQRLKENIRDLDDGLASIMALQPRKFDWKEGKGADTKNARGFIAQEFEEVFPDLIDEWKDPAPEGEDPYKSVRADLIPVLVKAIQEQQAIITALTARVAALESN